jgi:hypothetical protein
MNDLMLYCVMGLTVFFIIVGIVHGAGSQRSYIATPKDTKAPRDVIKPTRSQRAQEIWNRLNPTIYLDDDATEPVPQKRSPKRVKQG